MSQEVRKDREYACDDYALNYVSNKLDYAKTLLKVKELEMGSNYNLTMNLTNHHKYAFMNRINRILGIGNSKNYIKEKGIALILLCTVAIAFAGSNKINNHINIPFLKAQDIVLESERIINLPEKIDQVVIDTIPSRKTGKSKISINTNGKSYKIEKENGEVTRMEVDGKEIDPKDYDLYLEEMEDMDINIDDHGSRFNFRMGPGMHWDHEDMEGLGHGMERLNEIFGDEEFEAIFEGLGGSISEMMEQLSEQDFHFNGDSTMAFPFGDIKIFRDGDMIDLRGLEGLERLEELENLEGLRGLEQLGNLEFLEEMLEGLEGLEGLESLEGLEGGWGQLDRRLTKGRKTSDVIGRSLNEDGLLKIGEENEIELTGKHLKINGEKMPSNIWNKYKEIFEESTGTYMHDDASVVFKLEGKKLRKGLRRI